MAQIENASFEDWENFVGCSYETELINNFGVPNPLSGVINSWESSSPFGLCRTTDAMDGNYSIIIHNWYGYVQTSLSFNDTLSTRPNYLSGYYKFIGQHSAGQMAKGIGMITIFDAAADTIAHSFFLFSAWQHLEKF